MEQELQKLKELRESRSAKLRDWTRYKEDAQVMLAHARNKASKAHEALSRIAQKLDAMEAEHLSLNYDSGAETRRRRRKNRPFVNNDNYDHSPSWQRKETELQFCKLQEKYHECLEEDQEASEKCAELEEGLRSAEGVIGDIERQIQDYDARIRYLEEQLAGRRSP